MKVSNHTQVKEDMHYEAQTRTDKRHQYQGGFSGIHSSSWFRGCGSQHWYPPLQLYQPHSNHTIFFKEALQITDGGQSYVSDKLCQGSGLSLRGSSFDFYSLVRYSRSARSSVLIKLRCCVMGVEN